MLRSHRRTAPAVVQAARGTQWTLWTLSMRARAGPSARARECRNRPLCQCRAAASRSIGERVIVSLDGGRNARAWRRCGRGGTRIRSACAGLPRFAWSRAPSSIRRRRSRSKPARPQVWRMSSLSVATCSPACAPFQGAVRAAWGAAPSCARPAAKVATGCRHRRGVVFVGAAANRPMPGLRLATVPQGVPHPRLAAHPNEVLSHPPPQRRHPRRRPSVMAGVVQPPTDQRRPRRQPAGQPTGRSGMNNVHGTHI